MKDSIEKNIILETIIDTHIHLTDPKYQELGLEKVINQSKSAGVDTLICCGTTLEDSINAKKIADAHDSVYWALGWHPHEADNFSVTDLTKINNEIKKNDPKLIAIGEIGLDYYYTHSSKKQQKKVFEDMLALAERYNLPVIIHCREAVSDSLKILNKFKLKNIIAHSFTGTKKELNQFLERNAFISVNGMITFKKAENIKEITKNVPLDRLLIETDGPYLAPTPYRGKVNLPEYCPKILKAIAETKQIPIEHAAKKIRENTLKVYDL